MMPGENTANSEPPALLGPLSSGAFGDVFVGTASSGKRVAVKILSRNAPEAMKEVSYSLSLRHVYIVRTFEAIHKEDVVWLVQEYCDNGELFDYIAPLRGIEDEERIKKYFLQICAALTYIHSQDVVHRDIKPENVVLTQSDDVRLIDFGLAASANVDYGDCVGTISYMAPEIYLPTAKPKTGDGRAADVWSLGILLYTMITGTLPWDAPSRHDGDYDHYRRKGRFSYPWTDSLHMLFEGMLREDPSKRLSAADVASFCSQPWGLSQPPLWMDVLSYPLFHVQDSLDELKGRPPYTEIDENEDSYVVFTPSTPTPSSSLSISPAPPPRQRTLSWADMDDEDMSFSTPPPSFESLTTTTTTTTMTTTTTTTTTTATMLTVTPASTATTTLANNPHEPASEPKCSPSLTTAHSFQTCVSSLVSPMALPRYHPIASLH